MSKTPFATFLLCVLVGCTAFGGGLTEDERASLALYQSNAQLYYEGQRYSQALNMVRKGLDLEPSDYRLQSVAGWCYLQMALRDDDADRLVQAESYLDDVYQQRDPEDHMPQALLGYAATKQRLGREHERRAVILRREVETRELTETERTVRIARAQEHEQRAKSYWAETIRVLDELVDREELLRFAHKLLMETYVEAGDYENAVRHGALFLERNRDEQELQNSVIRETLVVAMELQARKELQDLIEQEQRVREALAEMHARRGAYEDAIEQLDVLLTEDPTRSPDYFNRGRALENLGRNEEARRDFEKFLVTTSLPQSNAHVDHAEDFTRRSHVATSNYETAVTDGGVFLQRNQQEQEVERAAIRETTSIPEQQKARVRLLELQSQEQKVRAELSELHYRRGDHTAAVDQLDALLEDDPTRSMDYYNRGRALDSLGRAEAARRDFEKFLATTSLPESNERVAHAREYTQR